MAAAEQDGAAAKVKLYPAKLVACSYQPETMATEEGRLKGEVGVGVS